MSSSRRKEGELMIQRFSPAERWAHRLIAVLMIVLLVTAALLYIPDFAAIVGNRQTVRVIHEAAGFALPVPLLLALFSRAFREDTARLNRFKPSDWKWLRSRSRRLGAIPVGKFNAGQKLNAAFSVTLKHPDVQTRLRALGSEIVGGAPNQLDAYFRAEVGKWSKLAEKVKFEVVD